MLVISILATLMVIVAIAAEYTVSINRGVQRTNTLQSAVAIADGCIDNNFAYWRAICRIAPTVAKTTTDLSVIPLPTGGAPNTQFPNVPNFTATGSIYNPNATQTVQQCKVVALDPEDNELSGTTPPIPAVGQYLNVDDPTKTTAVYNYKSTAYVTLPTMTGKVVSRVQRSFQKKQESPWGYAIFYVDPLEIHPSPPFNITGWVHTNGGLYTGHNTLHFLEKVSYVDDWYRGSKSGDPGFMPGDPRAVGGSQQETPTLPTWLVNQPPDRDDTHEPVGIDLSLFNTTDSNHNNDGYHELIEPPVAGADPLATQRYYNQADIVIEIKDNANPGSPDTVILRKPDGTPVDATHNVALYNMFNGAVTTSKALDPAFQDYREGVSGVGAAVRLATLDISRLINMGTDKKYKSANFNGIVYIYDSSAAANGVGAKRAIRLKKGSFIPQTGLGLTVASANPVYIQGDFNTGTNPPSNSGLPQDAGTPQAPGYTRQACSVLADAVNILSNNWNDANLNKGVSSRLATNTTVNTAIVSGIVPTGLNGIPGYSGGAENFPRFDEAWGSGHTLTYYGSMVELYQSQQAIGRWGSPNVYDPPTRQWFFDTNFRVDAPPGTLMVYTYSKGRWALAP